MSLPKSQKTPIRIVLSPKNRRPKLLSVPITLRPPKKLGRRKKTTAGTEGATVPAEYSDFADVFSKESAEVLPERTGINEHAIELEDGK